MPTETSDWLRGLGLERYATSFEENAIDGEILRELTADDLRELGVTLVGHRRKILRAIAALRDAAVAAAATSAVAPRSAPERRQLTVMFCDLVGSTALASRLDVEELREIVGAYQSAATEEVQRFGGFVAKYMGDGILVYFGYPNAHEADAERAVQAGLALVEAVSRLEAGGFNLAIRIGVATGVVVVGDLIGNGAAQERGVVGETPNLAARLQAMAEPNTVLDFRESLKFLLQSVDVGVTALLARRAVELHAFQFSLYYPYFTQLPPFKERPLPKKDVVALARKYAALQLFNYYASRALYKNTFGMKRTPSLNNIETGLADNFKPIEALLELLKDYLTAESDGRGVIEKGISRKGFVKEFRHQVEKSIAIARLIDAYMTNGDELPSTHGRPIGSKIMREALRKAASAKLSRSKVESVRVSQRDLTAWGLLSKLSQKTLFNYFDELEPTAVFLYLKEIHHCKPVLNPLDHYDKDFPQGIMQRARSVDDLRGVCLMYNAAVTELNEKYRFTFALIKNVPKPETETEYDALVDCERDPDLTEAIEAVTGQTA